LCARGCAKVACRDRVGNCSVRRGQGSHRIWEIDWLVTQRHRVPDVDEVLMTLRIV
jgi:hypothetical protein